MSGNPITLIKRGESLPFVFDRGGSDITEWTCTIKVLRFPGDTPEIDREVASSGDSWIGYLTSDETESLSSTGIWRLIGFLTNSTTDEQESVPVRFQLAEAWIT